MSDTNIRPPEGTNAKLRVGLIVDSQFASKYVYELAEWAKTQNDALVSHLIIQKADTARRSKKKGFLQFIRLASFALITTFENFRISRSGHYKYHLKPFDLTEIVPESITITPITSKTGSVSRYSAEDIRKIRDLDLDVLVRCGSEILRGDILKSARFGVISFRHADNRINRGVPPGFWEVYFKQDSTGFVVQQLTEDLNGGNVLIRGCFQTQSFFLLNQAALYTKSNTYLKQLLHYIAVARSLPPALDSQPYFNPLLELPDLLVQLKYISHFVLSIPFKVINRLFLKRVYRWGVAYTTGDWKPLIMCRATKIENPPNHFLADPFVISEGNREYCFLEDFDYRSSRGHISVYELKSSNAERLGEAIAEPFHMSFPYLFRFNSTIYMCPETSENNDIRVYECVKFPLEWKLSKVLMSNVSAVDTMIFEYDHLWWLFTNIDPTNTGSHFSELFVFY
jgi:hypothetical protein